MSAILGAEWEYYQVCGLQSQAVLLENLHLEFAIYCDVKYCVFCPNVESS